MANPAFIQKPDKDSSVQRRHEAFRAPNENQIVNIRKSTSCKKKNFNLKKQLADQGNAVAQYEVANCYRLGKGVLMSLDEALSYYELALAQGYKKEEILKEIAQSYPDCILAAYRGDPNGQYATGNYYLRGLFRRKSSFKKAFEYFKMAADQGHKQAQYQVGKCYATGGHGVHESWDEAIKYYQLAASQGHIEAIRLLFEYYQYGKHVPLSYEEAAKYLQLGAMQNDPESQFQLGIYYQKGKGNLPCSFSKALQYYKLAAAQGNHSAQLTLKSITTILHPHAQMVDIRSYLLDRELSTLTEIFEIYGKKPIFLNEFEFTLEEAQIISDAMIENLHFTVICTDDGLTKLSLAFELKGYKPDDVMGMHRLTEATDQPNVYGCVFSPPKKNNEIF